MEKYDTEIAGCTAYYSEQCAAMEILRGKIAAANYIAANSRMLILDAQGNINRCQEDIPTRKYELKQHLLKCKHDLYKLNTRLKIVAGDIAVMTTVLKMTDCAVTFAQTKHVGMLRCQDPCTHKSFLSFKHDEIQKQVTQLKSTFSHELMDETFKDLFEGVQAMESYALLETNSSQMPVINKTGFNNPPVPFTKVPVDPCTDPNAGAPSAQVRSTYKNGAKCTLSAANCYKLQERFLLIQAGIQDEEYELLDEISMLESFCEETKKTLEKQIEDDERLLSNSETKLAAAMEREADAGETARITAQEHDKMDHDLLRKMKTCTKNYLNAESELCALKKIRGELYKLRGTGQVMFFQDCAVSKWDAEECDKKCSGGTQKLKRSILSHADGGSKCLPLNAVRSCNNAPCPVDCSLGDWGGWSKCSAQCGGGVRQRLREVKRANKYGGHPCGAVSESAACSNQACELDCDLTDWTKWSTCSKLCDGGTKKRMKFIQKRAEGAGKCPDEWSMKRLQYEPCNVKRCAYDMGCNQTLDVILLLDGSGSLGKVGWDSEIVAAKRFIAAFAGANKAVDMAVILFSGPRTWSGVSKCIGRDSQATVSLSDCGIKTVTSFTNDLVKVDTLVTALQWPMGSTLTSLALMTAKSMLNLGRQNVHSVVVVITDGRPLSFRKTTQSSREIRKLARLVWVPVTNFAPLAKIKEWATRRWQENVVKVNDFAGLKEPDVVVHIIANICPAELPEVKFTRR
jgi:hypothetical protein